MSSYSRAGARTAYVALLATWPNDGEEGSLTLNGDGTILARPGAVSQKDRQRAWPQTSQGRSDNQAAKSC